MYYEGYSGKKTYKNGLPVGEKDCKQAEEIFMDNKFFMKYGVTIYTDFWPYESSVEFTKDNKFVKEFEFKGFLFVITLQTQRVRYKDGDKFITSKPFKRKRMYFQPISKEEIKEEVETKNRKIFCYPIENDMYQVVDTTNDSILYEGSVYECKIFIELQNLKKK
jgi:hypothetical protein